MWTVLRLKAKLETFDGACLFFIYLHYVPIESSDKALLSIVTNIVSSLFQPRVLQCFRLVVEDVFT